MKEANGQPTLLVPELMARVRQIQIRTHKLVNTAVSGGYRSTFRGTGLEFDEVRPYQPGDDVRSIDWNVTARTGQTFIKTYVEERELTLNLLVDTSASMNFGSRTFTKREAAAQLGALISFVAMHHGDRVGLTLFGERPGLHLKARKGSRHALRIVREVLAARTTGGESDLHSVLEHQLRTLKRRSMVFLLTDFLGQPLTPEGLRPGQPFWGDALASLALRHDVIALRVHDPFEEHLPKAGLIGLYELETGRRVELDTGSKSVRAEWRAQAEARKTALLELFARSRVEWIDLCASENLADPLVAFFRRRMLRHGGRAS